MTQDFNSDPHGTSSACSSAAGTSLQNQTGKFVFPGSLSLDLKRLIKGENPHYYKSLHNLRYQVYCKEAQFLNPQNYPAELEIDEFDTVSEHFLAVNANDDDDIVGTVRLVRWSKRHSFPTALYFRSFLELLSHLQFPLHSTAEISRLCISKRYRRRATDGLLGVESDAITSDQRRKYPAVILELFKIMYLASRYDLGITHWIASFQDSLCRLLDRFGVHLDLLNPDEINYYGKVRIYGASIQQIEETMKSNRPDLFDFFSERHGNA